MENRQVRLARTPKGAPRGEVRSPLRSRVQGRLAGSTAIGPGAATTRISEAIDVSARQALQRLMLAARRRSGSMSLSPTFSRVVPARMPSSFETTVPSGRV